MKKTFTLFVTFLFAISAFAQQPGSLDLSFGNNGISLQNFNLSSMGRAMKVLPDNRILIAGIAEHQTGSDGFLARYLPDGMLDESFGEAGYIILDTPGLYTSFYTMEINGDKIVLAGKAYFNGKDHIAVRQLTLDGVVDDSFGENGVVLLGLEEGSGEICEDIAIDSDGRLLLAGNTWLGNVPRPLLTRLTADGELDVSFGENGFVIPIFTSNQQFPDARFTTVLEQPDGKIVAGGYFGSVTAFSFMVSRYNQDGSLDFDFGTDGHFTMGNLVGEYQVYDLHLLENGALLVAGMVNITSVPAFGLFRLDVNGEPDEAFGQGGFALPLISLNGSYARAMFVEPNGNILLGGSSGSGFALVRFLPTGYIDSSFGADGVSTYNVPNGFGNGHAVALQSTGKILLAGFSHNGQTFINQVAILKFHSDADLTAVSELNAEDFKVFPNPFFNEFALMVNLDTGRQLNLLLYDRLGRLLKQSSPQWVGAGVQQILFDDLNDLPAGVYVLQVAGEKQQNSIRVIKQ